jgi:hypothetical protein
LIANRPSGAATTVSGPLSRTTAPLISAASRAAVSRSAGSMAGNKPRKFAFMRGQHDLVMQGRKQASAGSPSKAGDRIGIEHQRQPLMPSNCSTHSRVCAETPAPGPIAAARTRSSMIAGCASSSRSMIAVTWAACSCSASRSPTSVTSPAPTAKRRLRRQSRCPRMQALGPKTPARSPAHICACRLAAPAAPGVRSVRSSEMVQRKLMLQIMPLLPVHRHAFLIAARPMSDQQVHIIGGGLAGSEAAWQLAKRGFSVRLSEMRGGGDMTPAHQTDGLAELVCSNSFRSDDADNNAVGLLHQEMRKAGLAGDARRRSGQSARRDPPWRSTAMCFRPKSHAFAFRTSLQRSGNRPRTDRYAADRWPDDCRNRAADGAIARPKRARCHRAGQPRLFRCDRPDRLS